MATRYFDPRLQKKQYLDGEYETGPGFNSSQTELVDPAGSDTLTYRTEQTHVPPAGQSYEDPYSDMYDLPEGKTYINPSLAPKSGLKDPNAPIPPDIDPVDWKMGNTLNPERNQRSIIRQYVAQKYAKAADPEGVNNAKNYAQKMNTIGNVGHALDRMFTSHSVAHKGPGPDAGFWSGLKQQGQQAVQSAENDRRAKIEEYLTQKKLGSEGVQELGQMRELDRKAAMDNPTSEMSQRYQTAFAKMYPDYAEGIEQVPASEIQQYFKMAGDQASMELERKVKEQELASEKSRAELEKDKLGFEKTKFGRDTELMTPGTPQSVAAVDSFKKLYPEYADVVDSKTTSAADVEAIMKQVQQKEELNVRKDDKIARNDEIQTRKDERKAKDLEEREVPGIGLARTKQEAIALRENGTNTQNIVSSIDSLINLRKSGNLRTPFHKDRGAAETEMATLRGYLRIPMQGPGAMTESDKKDLNDTIGNVTAFFSMDDNVIARLESIKNRINQNLNNSYNNHIIDFTGKGAGENKKIPPPNGLREVRQGGVNYRWDDSLGEYVEVKGGK